MSSGWQWQAQCIAYFILLPVIGAESGSGAAVGYETTTDAEMDTKFTCATQLLEDLKKYLICDVTGAEETLNGTFFNFTIVRDKSSNKCIMESPLKGRCLIRSDELIVAVVCLTMTWRDQQTMTGVEQQSPQLCQNLKPMHIVKPEAPFGLNITYQEDAHEYLIQFSTLYVPEMFNYLYAQLIHQIAYRQLNRNWTTTESEHLQLKLQGKEFQPNKIYEIKVRSKPNGKFYKGTWSEWSSSVVITAAAKADEREVEHVFIVASVFSFILLLMLSMIPIFWKNRIKPVVWPALPNHEKTLDKLCHRLRKNSDISFFHPESLGYVHIHKVDSIRAKSELNHFPQSSLPWQADVSEKMGNGPEPKQNLIHINHGWLKLPLAYEGMWPVEMQNGPLGGRPHANIHANLCDESSSGDSTGDTLSTRSNSSTDPMILAGLETDNCHQANTRSETRVSNNEDVYVTMASFFQNKRNARK